MASVGPIPGRSCILTNAPFPVAVWIEPDQGDGFGSALVLGHKAGDTWLIDATILQPGDDGSWQYLADNAGGLGTLLANQEAKINANCQQRYNFTIRTTPVTNNEPYSLDTASAALGQYFKFDLVNGAPVISQKPYP